MKKLYILLLSLALLIILYTSYNINRIKTVSATTLKTIKYSPYLTVSGEFENSEKSVISLSYPVCIKNVHVTENQYVNKGQLLFTVDIEKMGKILSGDYKDVLFDIDYSDLSTVKTSNFKTDISRISPSVYATTDGYIEKIDISRGGIAMAEDELITISHAQPVIARFTLSQQDFGKVSVGDRVNISSVVFSDHIYHGVISDKKAVVKKQNSMSGNKVVIDVFADIINPDSRVSNGLQIKGEIQNDDEKIINAIDYNYINQDTEGEFVYILQNGRALKKYIDTGIETEDYTEVITYFDEGTIFLSGEISEGSRVIISE